MASPQPASPTRRSRGFSSSGRSDKSEKTHRSSGSGHKIHLTETAEEKHRRSLQTKADPMLAMSEAQPNLVALEKSNLGSLRSMQHKDQYGNVISMFLPVAVVLKYQKLTRAGEPDLSNPTRPRFERPLDTIRSFEAAIYGSYAAARPTSYAQQGEYNLGNSYDVSPVADLSAGDDATTPGDYSRRSSYYNPHSHSHNRQYSDRGYPNRPNYSRPNSYHDNGNGHYNGGGPSESYYPYNQGGGRRPRQHHRGHSGHPSYAEQQNGYSQNGYGQNGYYKSSDNVTVASPSGSGSTPDQWANSTDPSSINSSLDQFQQQQQLQQQQQEQAMAESYGFQGFGAGPSIDEETFAGHAAGKAPYGQAQTQDQAPAPPAHDPNAGGPVGGTPLVAGRRHLQRKSMHQPQQSVSSDAGDKRKSWFKRRFSKNN
ncbi:uncharacterized protein BDV14DRAFT_140765 [Aspergillus stella-maris]|uniref:uncharacterized protein n=1 Tax=Aspergillus stella-maris TaxID=1810926 RepID=UPI003CCD887D